MVLFVHRKRDSFAESVRNKAHNWEDKEHDREMFR